MKHAFSGEILTKESRFPRSEIFFATLGLREFLKSCANAATEQIDPENFTKQMQQKNDTVLKQRAYQILSLSLKDKIPKF